MAAAPGPALPWGQDVKQQEDVKNVQDVSEEELQPVSLQAVGLEPGARIEVMWEVSTEEGEPYSKWFPATISCSSSSSAQPPMQADAAGADTAPAADAAGADTAPAAAAGASAKRQQQQQQHCYTLKYDGSDEFPEETATVMLLGQHELYDNERRDAMVWRQQGEAWEPPADSASASEEEEEQEGADGFEGGSVSAMELADATPEEIAAAEAAEAAMLERLTHAMSAGSAAASGGGPSSAAAAGAAGATGASAYVKAGYEDFKSQFKAFIAAKASCAAGDGDSSLLITTQDVQEFTAMMKTQRATAHHNRR